MQFRAVQRTTPGYWPPPSHLHLYPTLHPEAKADTRRLKGLNVSSEIISSLENAPPSFAADTAAPGDEAGRLGRTLAMRHKVKPTRAKSFRLRQTPLHPETKKGGDYGNQFVGGKPRLSENISFSQDTAAPGDESRSGGWQSEWR